MAKSAQETAVLWFVWVLVGILDVCWAVLRLVSLADVRSVEGNILHGSGDVLLGLDHASPHFLRLQRNEQMRRRKGV